MLKIVRGLALAIIMRMLFAGYIDPNTGGMLFQILAMIFGLITGILLFFSSRIRMGVARLQRHIRERFGSSDPVTSENDEFPDDADFD